MAVQIKSMTALKTGLTQINFTLSRSRTVLQITPNSGANGMQNSIEKNSHSEHPAKSSRQLKSYALPPIKNILPIYCSATVISVKLKNTQPTSIAVSR